MTKAELNVENALLLKEVEKQARALAILTEAAKLTLKNFPAMKGLRNLLTLALDILGGNKMEQTMDEMKSQYAKDFKEFGRSRANNLWQFNTGNGWLNCIFEGPQWAPEHQYRRKSSVEPTKPVDKQGGLDIDLEQAIMHVWSTVEDMQLKDISKETIIELLNARCEQLFEVFTESLKHGR